MNGKNDSRDGVNYAHDHKYPVAIAAKMLGVSKQTVYRMVEKREIGCYVVRGQFGFVSVTLTIISARHNTPQGTIKENKSLTVSKGQLEKESAFRR